MFKEKPITMTDKTHEKHKLVIDEYFINGFNGVKAYQKFYPNAKDKTADKRFRDLTEIDRNQDYISQKQESAQEKLQTSHEALLEELRSWAYSDITDTIMLSPEDIKNLPLGTKRLISKFKTVTRAYFVDGISHSETVVELSFVSKERAMEMILKHVGFYEKNNSQKIDHDPNIHVFIHGKEISLSTDD